MSRHTGTWGGSVEHYLQVSHAWQPYAEGQKRLLSASSSEVWPENELVLV